MQDTITKRERETQWTRSESEWSRQNRMASDETGNSQAAEPIELGEILVDIASERGTGVIELHDICIYVVVV